MRTTLRIDDDLLRELKELAHQQNVSLGELVNRTIRQGLKVSGRQVATRRRPYREQVFSLGEPRVPLDKALALAASLEDLEVSEKMARRK